MDLFTKICSKCRKPRPFEDFHADKRTADGLQRECKKCRAERRKNRPYQQQQKVRQRAHEREQEYRRSRVALCPSCHQQYQGRACKPCKALYMREWLESNHERVQAQRVIRYQTKCKGNPEYIKAKKEQYAKYYARLKAEVFAHYGGQCYCCKLADPRFLTIDHADDDGAKYKHPGGKRIAGTSQLRMIKVAGFPSNIRLACWNCNCGRAYNNGICPHQQDIQDHKGRILPA